MRSATVLRIMSQNGNVIDLRDHLALRKNISANHSSANHSVAVNAHLNPTAPVAEVAKATVTTSRKHPESDEQILLARLSQGDSNAFWPLWMPHQDYLYHRCLRWMDGNIAEAEDALSQAALKAWQKLPTHAYKVTNLRAWLTRFTHNFCVDIHRKQGRRAVGIDNFEEIAGQLEASQSFIESPESAILSSELDMTIHDAISMLPARLRSPFVMRFQQDMSYLEITRKLSISIDNVYKRISQARAILKPQLSQYLSEMDNFERVKIHRPLIKTQKNPNLDKTMQPDFSPKLLVQAEARGEILYNRKLPQIAC
jgi:RNA polymerase sigma factor (sigma-70 family)